MLISIQACHLLRSKGRPAWPQLFEEEEVRIKQALGENCIASYYIGSPSVPGLAAKPKIDIFIEMVGEFLGQL